MKDKILFILCFMSLLTFPKFLSSEDKCKEWFQELNIAEDPNCGVKCVTSSTDMGTWDCVYRCDEFCPKKSTDNSKCEKIRNPGLVQKILKWPKNPINIFLSYMAKMRAIEKSEELFPDVIHNENQCNPRHNGPGDAFRHCNWTCNMTKLMGVHTALDYSDWYEFYKPGPCEEAQMDYHNNRAGTQIAMTDGDCDQDCMDNTNLLILKEYGECR